MHVAQVDFTKSDASDTFVKSIRETGFAVITNHPIDYSLVQEVFAEWAEFFASDYKNNYLYDNDKQDGFFPMNVSELAIGYDVKDLKEFYNCYLWGRYPQELSNKTKQLHKQMVKVALAAVTWAEKHLPADIRAALSEPLSNMITTSDRTFLRVIHYPPITGNEEPGAVRAGAHTDTNLITVLAAASESGLQVQDLSGKWWDVPTDPGMLVINAGDMLKEATADFYPSTRHQVVNPINNAVRNKSRYSIPLFVQPRLDTVLSQRYTAGEFWAARMRAHGVLK